MRYIFRCPGCFTSQIFEASIHDGPPSDPTCPSCKASLERHWKADVPQICCRENLYEIPHHARVAADPSRGLTQDQADKLNRAYQEDITYKRKNKKRGGSLTLKKSVPAEFFHGKIRETGDPHFWDDPSNADRFKEFDV